MKLLVLLTVLLSAVSVYAFKNGQIQNAPYNQALRNIIDYQALDGQHTLKVAKVTYDFNVYGGASGSYFNLNQYLPTNATVIRDWGYVVTQLAPSGTTIALKCGGATLLSATDETGVAAGSVFEGAATGAASAFLDTGTTGERCQFQTEFGVHAATAGKVNFYIEYVVHN